MDVIPEAGSKKAVVGYASYANDCMQFLETRMKRKNKEDNNESVELYPKDILDSKKKNQDLIQAFLLLSKVGKYATQIALDASNIESNVPKEDSKKFAKKLVRDLLDDGTAVSDDDT